MKFLKVIGVCGNEYGRIWVDRMKNGALVIVLRPVLVVTDFAGAEERAVLKNEKKKMSGSIGANFGNRQKSLDVEIDVWILMQGMKDAYAGRAPHG